VARYLADVSALARLHRTDVLARVGPLVMAGEVATCGVTDLELLRAAGTAEAHAAVRADGASLPRVPVDDGTVERAVEVQALLIGAGTHRDVPVTSLLVAAAAERAGLVLLHDDDRVAAIAATTGQPAERVTS
jgi:predicted nucleic acid-binding protein